MALTAEELEVLSKKAALADQIKKLCSDLTPKGEDVDLFISLLAGLLPKEEEGGGGE